VIHFEGEQTFSHPIAEVMASLSDVSFLLDCLGSVDRVIESTSDYANWKLKPPFAFVAGMLDISLKVLERLPDSTKFEIVSKSVGATSTVESVMHFAPSGDGTHVRWVGDITALTGLLKLVPRPLIQGAANKVISDTWESIRKKLGA